MGRSLLKNRVRFLTMLISFVALFGCSPNLPFLPAKSAGVGPLKVEGNKLISDNELLGQIKPGTTTKEEVASLIGSPKTIEIDKLNGGTKWAYQYFEIYSYSPFYFKQVVLFLWFDDKGVLKPKPDGMVRFKTTGMRDKQTTTRD